MRLSTATVHGDVLGALEPMLAAHEDNAARRALRLAEQIAREHAALNSYLRDDERSAGRSHIADHYATQAEIALSVAPELRAMWAGDMSVPLSLAEHLLRVLESLVASLRAYEDATSQRLAARRRRRPAAPRTSRVLIHQRPGGTPSDRRAAARRPGRDPLTPDRR